jgi:hypothetical protein
MKIRLIQGWNFCKFCVLSKLSKINITIPISHFLVFHLLFIIFFLLHYFYAHQQLYVKALIVIFSLIKYTSLVYFQLFLGVILLWMLIDKLGFAAEYAKFMQICILTSSSYFIQRPLIFKYKTL